MGVVQHANSSCLTQARISLYETWFVNGHVESTNQGVGGRVVEDLGLEEAVVEVQSQQGQAEEVKGEGTKAGRRAEKQVGRPGGKHLKAKQ